MHVGNNDISQLIFDQEKWVLSNSNKIIKEITALNDLSSANQIRIYPNPASGFFEISNSEFIDKVELVSSSGISFSKSIENGRVLVSELPSGYYMLVLHDREKGLDYIRSVVIDDRQ